MKVHKTISVDAEVWEFAQKSFPNQLSQIIEDYLRHYNAIQNVTEYDTSIYELRAKIDENQQKKAEIAQKVAGMMQKLRILEKKQAENVQKKKDEEIKQAEKLKKCAICGGVTNENELKTLANGKICNVCLLTADRRTDKFKELLGK